jgi:hypothetical protein
MGETYNMPKRPREVDLKPKRKRQQNAVDLEQKTPKGDRRLLLQAQSAIGVHSAEVATMLVAQAAGMPAVQTRTGPLGPENIKTLVQTAIQMLDQIKPEGALQSMLAVQMIGVHNTAIKFLMRATDENQTFEGTDANVQRAVRLMPLFNHQLEALACLRGKTSQQKVTVKHVHVHEGGQAIVGNVTKIGDVPKGEGEANEN